MDGKNGDHYEELVAAMNGKEPRPPEGWEDTDPSGPTSGKGDVKPEPKGTIGGPVGEH